MPTSGIVPIPCADVAEGMVQLPANLKRPSKLSGALARRAVRRKVLEHVALGHGSCRSAQISTSCWLHLVAGCFSPFNGVYSRLFTNVKGAAMCSHGTASRLDNPQVH